MKGLRTGWWPQRGQEARTRLHVYKYMKYKFIRCMNCADELLVFRNFVTCITHSEISRFQRLGWINNYPGVENVELFGY